MEDELRAALEAVERGWDKLFNGEWLRSAEAAGYEVLSPPTRTSGIGRTWPGDEPLSWLCAMRNGIRSRAK